MKKKKKKPKFLRQMWKAYKRIRKVKWRRPKGSQSKLRKRMKGKGAVVSIGYGSPKEVRGLHPCGLKEVLVHNPKELEKVDPEREVVRISSRVGKKKRIEIIKKAEELKIKVLNPQV